MPKVNKQRQGLCARLRRARPASANGSSTPSRTRASSATTPGLTPGQAEAGRQYRRTGRRCRPMRNWAWSISAIELPTGDQMGIYRPGNSLFSESMVAVDIETGKRKWHYQMIHHGLWDRDVPCAADPVRHPAQRQDRQGAGPAHQAGLPLCAEPRDRQADLADPGKEGAQGRCAGRMVFADPAHSRPSRRPSTGRASTPDDLIDFTPELHAKALEIASHYKTGPALHRADHGEAGRALGHHQPAAAIRRHQLAGRLLRSGNPHGLHLFPDQSADASAASIRAIRDHTPRRSSTMSMPILPAAERACALGDLTVRGPAADQAALWPHHRHRSGKRHPDLAGRPWRDAGRHPQPSGAEGPEHSAHRQDRQDRAARPPSRW